MQLTIARLAKRAGTAPRAALGWSSDQNHHSLEQAWALKNIMDAKAALVVVCLLVLGHCTLQQTTSKKRNGKKGADSAAIEEMKKQISNIVMELNVLKEQQALQTVCLRGMKILGKCFLADHIKKNFHSASDDCIAKGGTLATPLNLDENEQLYDYVRQSIGPEEHIWLGINDMVMEGVWSENTGAVLRYANWETEITHQPDGATRQNCAVMSTRAKGKWFDENSLSPVLLFMTTGGFCESVV